MNLLSAAGLLAALFHLKLGLYVWNKRQSDSGASGFLAICLCMAVWSLAYAFLYSAGSTTAAWVFYRIGSLGWILLPPAFLAFILQITGRHGRGWKIFLATGFATAAGLLVLSFTGAVFATGFGQGPYGVYEIHRPGNPLYMAYLFFNLACFIPGLLLLTTIARRDRDWRRQRMASVTRNGALTSMLGVAAGNILIPALGSHIPAIGTLLTVLGSWWIWRGISNFRLLNIRSDHTLTEVMDKMMDMLFLLDHQARILEANPQCQQVTGCRTADFRGRPLSRFVLEKKLLASHLDACEKKQVHSRRFACHLHGPGPVPVELYLSPIYNTADRPDGYVVVAHDMRGTLDLQLQIKERKRAETRLKKTMQALESERNILRTKQELINAELALARTIQQQLLPVLFRDETIGVFFRPMEALGGDFFDFLEMEDSLGIFMSDVSGHGVPAALISAMVKSILLQSRDVWADPAALLAAVNQTLCGQTSGNYVTALYGVYDRRRRTFRYANAGHPSPWRIPADGAPARQLADEARGVPLGIWDNGEVRRLGKGWRNMELQLARSEKLFLYTDGLVDAEKNGETFGERRLPQTLARHHAGSAEQLVLALSRARYSFRADSDSEDDVCMICIAGG